MPTWMNHLLDKEGLLEAVRATLKSPALWREIRPLIPKGVEKAHAYHLAQQLVNEGRLRWIDKGFERGLAIRKGDAPWRWEALPLALEHALEVWPDGRFPDSHLAIRKALTSMRDEARREERAGASRLVLDDEERLRLRERLTDDLAATVRDDARFRRQICSETFDDMSDDELVRLAADAGIEPAPSLLGLLGDS